MEYFTFGMHEMRVTQSYDGKTSHIKHWQGSKNYCDFPIDVAGNDGGRSWFFAPVDMEVVAIKGQENSMTNTIWLRTTNRVQTPSGQFKVFIALTHWNDNDPHIAKLKVGSIIKKGEPICEEGTDGATANHLHLVIGNADKDCGNGLIQNSNGKWVSNGWCLYPQDAMYIDKNFTQVLDTCGINFQEVPKEPPKEETFFDDNGWFGFGDNHENIGKIADFLCDKFVRGNYYGDYIKAIITEFQKKKNIEADGNIGPITLQKLKEEGFKE